MKPQIILIMFFAIFSSLACQKTSFVENQSVIVRTGTSFGFCVGNCIRDLEINSLQMTFTIKKREARGSNVDLVVAKTCQDKITQDESNKLLQLANFEEFKKNSETIGCPDCADGGAEWIEIEKNGSKYRVTFEYTKDVKEFSELLKFVRTKRINFENTCK